MTGSALSLSQYGASMPPAQWLVESIIASSLRSCSVTAWPACANNSAAQAPAMPAPMMETGGFPPLRDGQEPAL